jgi:hypothetical protein
MTESMRNRIVKNAEAIALKNISKGIWTLETVQIFCSGAVDYPEMYKKYLRK